MQGGLRPQAAGWPGVHCLDALLEASLCKAPGSIFLEYEARRQGVEFGARDFSSVETVSLTPLPCWRHLTAAEYREHIADLVEVIESETELRRRETGRAPRGAKFILRQHPHDLPTQSKKSPAPAFHAATQVARRALVEAYRIFLAAYRQASDSLRAGERTVEFPRYCFPPPLPFSRPPAAFASG